MDSSRWFGVRWGEWSRLPSSRCRTSCVRTPALPTWKAKNHSVATWLVWPHRRFKKDYASPYPRAGDKFQLNHEGRPKYIGSRSQSMPSSLRMKLRTTWPHCYVRWRARMYLFGLWRLSLQGRKPSLSQMQRALRAPSTRMQDNLRIRERVSWLPKSRRWWERLETMLSG